MKRDEFIDLLTEAVPQWRYYLPEAGDLYDALTDRGLEVVPSDVAKLGRHVAETMKVKAPTLRAAIYAMADVTP